MSIAEKLIRAKSDYDAVYEAGKAQGGGDNYYDTFWDAFQSNGNRVHHNYAFAGAGWDNTTYNPKYPFKKITYANYMFFQSNITNTKQPIALTSVKSIGCFVFVILL